MGGRWLGLGADAYTACRFYSLPSLKETQQKKLSSLCRTSSAALFQSADPIFLVPRTELKRRRNKLEKRLLRPRCTGSRTWALRRIWLQLCVRRSVRLSANSTTETRQLAARWVHWAIYSEQALQTVAQLSSGLSARFRMLQSLALSCNIYYL